MVPVHVSIEAMENIAILCDKYDMTKLCRFRISDWASELMKSHYLGTRTEYICRALSFIAWTFGWEELLEFAATGVARHTMIDHTTDRNPLDYPDICGQEMMPPAMTGKTE